VYARAYGVNVCAHCAGELSPKSRTVKLFAERPVRDNPEWTPLGYYPPHPMFSELIKLLRLHGLFRDEQLDFNEEMRRAKDKRGKVMPKIGEGKRRMQKKTK
jgi:hypothetical protein